MADIKTRIETRAVRVTWARMQYRTKDNSEWTDLTNAYSTRYPTNICDLTIEEGGLFFCQQAENYTPHVCTLPIRSSKSIDILNVMRCGSHWSLDTNAAST